MAEAFQWGVDVIATAFGGNTDFCTGPLSHPVRWRKAPIPRGSYPYGQCHFWAEPDLMHAAELCQQVAHQKLSAGQEFVFSDSRSDRTRSSFCREKLSFISTGSRYLKRLNELWADRARVNDHLCCQKIRIWILWIRIALDLSIYQSFLLCLNCIGGWKLYFSLAVLWIMHFSNVFGVNLIGLSEYFSV